MNKYFGYYQGYDDNVINAEYSLVDLDDGLDDLLLGERPVVAFASRARAEREKHIAAIDDMYLKTAEDRIKEVEDELEHRDREVIEELVAKIQYAPAREIVQKPLAPCWMYGISPIRWQASAFLAFIQSAKHGSRFRSCDLGGWLRAGCDFDRDLWSLFQLIRQPTEAVSKILGAPEIDNFGWFLTEEENRRLPDFYRPLDAFRMALDSAGILGPYQTFSYTRRILWDQATNSIHGA